MLSIIVPIYNTDKYLKQCLDSIVGQSYKDFELILVDDGSKDNSIDICKQYCQRYKNIYLIEGKHEGVFKARKKGIRVAKGEYITFVDSDDFIDSDAYEKAISAMNNDVDVISFDIFRYYSDQEIRYDACVLNEGIYDKKSIIENIFPLMIWNEKNESFGVDPALWNKIYKSDLIKAIYESIDDIDFQYGEDVLIVYPLLFKAVSLQIFHQAFYYHRQRAKNILPSYITEEYFYSKLYKLYTLLSKEMSFNKIFQRQIDLFYAHSVNLKKRYYGIYNPPQNEIFPFDKIRYGEKIVIYGAGNIGKLYMNQLNQLNYCKVILWVDREYQEMEEQIKSPELIVNIEFEHLVIAIANIYVRKQIYEYLINMGISDNKIIRREKDDF